VLFAWYPDFFYTIDGGWEGMRIIIGADLARWNRDFGSM